MQLKLIKLLPWCFGLCFCLYFGDLRLAKVVCPSSPPRGIWQLKCPQPREFAIQEINANAQGLAQEGGLFLKKDRQFENIPFPSLKSPK